MSTENNNPVDASDDVDLDTFSAEFFGQSKAEPEPASSTDQEDEPVVDANTEDAHDDETDTLAPDEEDETEEVEEEAPKPKKNRLQERIDQLVHKEKEKDRQLQAALARLEALETKAVPEPKAPVSAATDSGEPDPSAKNEDGSDKYPLGEYDPAFNKDLVKYTIAKEREAAEIRKAEEAIQEQAQKAQQALAESWQVKLNTAKEQYPDFDEKAVGLVEAFDGIDDQYGAYLSQTIMGMEYGQDVLYYLANNLDEARTIFNSGGQKAAIALGRLEARFAFANEEKETPRPRVSKAPTPPTHLNKGSSVAVAEIPDDTDDLDAFSQKFFSKKKRF